MIFTYPDLDARISHIAAQFSKKLEDLVLEEFRVRGFPKDWIMKNAERISARQTRNESNLEEVIYSVDKADLFKVKITSTYDDDRFYITYNVKTESCKFKTPT